MGHSEASFILQLAPEIYVFKNRPITPFTKHPFCRLFSSLKYEKAENIVEIQISIQKLSFKMFIVQGPRIF